MATADPTLLEAISTPDPVERLQAIRKVEAVTAARAEAARIERRRVIAEIRELGLTWRVIGDLIGVSAQAAERLGATPTTTTTTKDT